MLRRLLGILLASLVALTLPACGGSTQPGTPPTVVARDSGNDRFGVSPGADILWEPRDEMVRELDLYRDMGFGWIRLDIDWHSIEAEPGVFDWAATDRVVNAARQRGLRVLGMIAYTPSWAAKVPRSAHSAPADPAQYAAFAGAVVGRYRPLGVRDWEIWNEPNSSLFWLPRPDVAAYADLLRAASRTIRAADPDAVIVAGALAPATDAANGAQIAPATFVAGLYEQGASPAFDVLSVHPYTYPRTADHPASTWQGSFDLAAIHRLMTAAGDPKPLWITEYGAPTGTDPAAVDQQRQAQILTSAMGQRWVWLKRVFLYGGRDRGTDPADREQNFGFVTQDFVDKTSRRALEEALRGSAQPSPP